MRPLSNGQESAVLSEKVVEGARAHEQHDSPRGKDGRVHIIKVDANKAGDVSKLKESNISVYPHHSTPLSTYNKQDDTCVFVEARATSKLIFIVQLLVTALWVLIQTNLSSPVTCLLSIAAVSAFSYLFLIVAQSRKKNMCPTYVADVCFGITTFAMMLATFWHVWYVARTPATVSNLAV